MVGRQAFVRIFWFTMGACLMTVISEHYFIKYGAYDSSSALRLDPGQIFLDLRANSTAICRKYMEIGTDQAILQ